VRNIILILLVLGLSYAVARLLSGNADLAGKISIAALFCFTALGHFAKPNEMVAMLPPWWAPFRKPIVLLSGLLELAFAIGILIPATSRLTAIVAVAFLFLATPLNVYSAYRRITFGGHSAGPAYLLVRLPLQIFLIAWIWWFALRNYLP
jgi:uncharacterized membrane protein